MSEERKTIYLCLAHMSDEGYEQKYVKEAFDTNWVVPMGPNVNAFEEDLRKFVTGNVESAVYQDSRWPEATAAAWNLNPALKDTKVVCLSAGTAAVHLALLACGVGPGDEVCVQSFTFCASSHPITYLGATPVFIDSEADTWNMDPQLLEQAILDRKEKTGKYPKAIVPVALYGMPYKIDEIMAIANKYGIPVVEDAAEGMGSKFNGQVLGTFGKFGVLSFNGNKMITTSGGGALICNSWNCKNDNDNDTADAYDNSRPDGKKSHRSPSTGSGQAEGESSSSSYISGEESAREVMWYATQARDAYPYYEHTAIGYNYRMSNVCAGIGRGQMTVLDQHIAHHKHVQELYKQLLKDVPGITLHEQPADPRYDANFWLCAATIDPEIRIKGQENAYKEVIKTAVGGAAGVIKAVDSATTDCQPNENVEALRIFMLSKKVECRPVWKPMHKQPVYNALYELRNENEDENWICYEGPKSSAYLRKESVCESIFKVGFCLPAGPYVSDDDVRYIVDCIKEAIDA